MYDYLVAVRDAYKVKVSLNMFSKSLADNIEKAGLDEAKVVAFIQKLADFFYSQHFKHFNDNEEFMKFYWCCRSFNPAYPNKAPTVELATQHWKYGYYAYRKDPLVQKILTRQYNKYLEDNVRLVGC